jgi:hypothetical protein
MANDPQFRMNTGTPNQLPKGAAQDLNEAAAAAAPQDTSPFDIEEAGAGDVAADQGEEETAPGPIQTSPRGSIRAQGGMNEDDKLVFGKTSRPNEPLTTGSPANPKSIPPGLASQLSGLISIAKDPNAPPSIKALVRILAHDIGEDN